MSIKRRSGGFTLIELIVAMVIIGVGVAGVMAAFSTSVRGSGDALVSKQMLAAAEAMMEEVLLKPHTVTGAAPGNAPTACGPAASRNAFDDVRDYNGYQTTGVCDAGGAAVPGLNGYGVSVAVAPMALGGVANTLRVTVTVTQGGNNLILDGFRTPP
jgi:MSHA pilin protein MshD